MNPKTTMVLVGALALAVVGVWLAQPGPAPAVKSGESATKSLVEVKTEDVTAFEIKHGGDPSCSFKKDDNKWQMTAPVAGPAETYAVNGDIGKIVGMQSEQSFDPSEKDAPGDEITMLGKPQIVAKLTDKNGKSTVVKVGARQQLSRKTYVQIEGDKKIYVVNGDLNADMRRKVSDYRGKRVADFNTADAVRLEIAGAQHMTLAKADGGWTVEEPFKARADLATVNKLLGEISGLNALEFVADDTKSLRPYGLENPRLTVTITVEKKTPKKKPDIVGPTSAPAVPEYDVKKSTIAVAFGGKAEDRVFAKLADPASKTVFQVNEAALKTLSTPSSDVRDKKIAAVSTERASQVKLISGGDSTTLTRVGSDWKIDGTNPVELAESAAVDDLLRAVREAKAVGFEDAESPTFGFAQPRASIEISIEGQTTPLKLRIGADTPSKTGVYVKNEGENFVAVIPIATADSIAVQPVAFRSRELVKFDLSNASRLEISRPSKSIAMSRSAKGWCVTAPMQGDVDQANLDKALGDLSALRGRKVVAAASDAAKYELGASATKVALTITPPAPASQPASAPAAPLAAPIVHTILVARHAGKVYAMQSGGPVICELDAKIADDLEAEMFDRQIFKLATEKVSGISVSGAADFAFEKRGDAWKLVGESSFGVDPSKVTTLLQSLHDAKAERFMTYAGTNPAEYRLDKPEMTLKLKADDGEQVLLVSSDGPPTGGRYAAIAAHPERVFVLSAADFGKISRKVTDFQVKT